MRKIKVTLDSNLVKKVRSMMRKIKVILDSNSSVWGMLLRGSLIGVGLAVVFITGFIFRGLPAFAGSFPIHENAPITDEVGKYPLLTQVQELLNQNFLRPQPSQRQLEYGAIRGLVSLLNDKYTFFVDPPVAASESNVLAGQYGGIGVQVQRNTAGKFALYPFRDGPAMRAGLQDGDLLLKVNDKDVPLTTQQDAVDQLLRGEVKNNNSVKIRVLRPSTNEEKEFTIPFAVIEVPSVIWRTLAEVPSFGYIQILRFTGRTPEELKQAISELRGKNITAVVLDLRNNPGGLLDESIQVAGQFLNGGVVLYEHSRDGEKSFDAQTGGQMLDLPMVALINQGTASAGELVAGALHDRQRAKLIGQQSYGKGSIQLIFALADQSSLHVTTAEWLTPNKTSLDGKGIAPDIPITPDPGGRDLELDAAIRSLQQK